MKEYKINYLGGAGQERMIRNGWDLVTKNYNESTEEFVERLSKYYKKIKLYWVGTRIPGIHSEFAMCK